MVPQFQVVPVSHAFGANLDISALNPVHLIPASSATWPVAGLSWYWASTSTPAATKLSAAWRSTLGSYHVEVHTRRTSASGFIDLAPNVKALTWRSTSGMGKAATKPIWPDSLMAPATIPSRYLA